MTPLIDGDILLYEVGFGAVTGWKSIINWEKGSEEPDPPPWDYVAKVLHDKIDFICRDAGGTEPPRVFLTGSTNFREEIAKRKGYKAQRKGLKPFHYDNIKAYLKGAFDAEIVEGLEADDLLSITQCSEADTIICSRDKDLRQVPGWHYGWEVGNQPSFGPLFVEGYGSISLPTPKKLTGYGPKFFLSQLIMGDPVDNIPGIPKCGPVEAFNTLDATLTYEEGLEAVVGLYKGRYGDSWEEEILEQGQLLWMVRELDKDGKPVMWKL